MASKRMLCCPAMEKEAAKEEQERACVQAAPGLAVEMELGIDPALPSGLVIGCDM